MTDDPSAGPPWLDHEGRRFLHPAGATRLRQREFAILEFLLRSPGETLSRDTIAEHVFGPGHAVAANVLELYVARLRKQLQGSDVCIHTVRGQGYMLVIPCEGDP